MAILIRITSADDTVRKLTVPGSAALAIAPGDRIELVGIEREAVQIIRRGDDVVVRLENGEEISGGDR